jgi:recombinational DNA repair ATPase RecF
VASSGPRCSPSSWPSSTSSRHLDGRPPLLLLDDVFSELDPDRRSHLVRRIAALPQAFVTTTTLDDLDPELLAIATAWEVRTGPDGARLVAAPASVP